MTPPATTAERQSATQRRRQPVQARSRERIDLIIDTAAYLVDSCGADAVTTTLIAEHAGISVGSIYSYFRDRSSIFDAIVRRSIARLDVIAFEARDRHAGADFVTASCAVIDAIAELYRTAPGFRSLYLSQFVSPEMLATMQESDEEHVRLLLERMRRDSGQYLDCDDPTMAMRLYVGLVDKGLDLAFRIDPQGDPQMICETKEAVALYLGSLLRPLDTTSASPTQEAPA